MKSLLKLSCLKIFSVCMFVEFTCASIVHANEDMEEGEKSKKLVEEAKKKEGEMREETEKNIKQMRELALKHLEKFYQQFLDQKKQPEADSIAIEINRLRRHLDLPPLEGSKKAPSDDAKDKVAGNDKQNNYFKFRVDYVFDEPGVIKGKFVFLPNQKVTIFYSYKNNAEQTTTSDWKDNGDHIQIDTDTTMGQIIISTNPSSNHNALTIRWGGELSNKITEAKTQ